jgi:hypothetical protein
MNTRLDRKIPAPAGNRFSINETIDRPLTELRAYFLFSNVVNTFAAIIIITIIIIIIIITALTKSCFALPDNPVTKC